MSKKEDYVEVFLMCDLDEEYRIFDDDITQYKYEKFNMTLGQLSHNKEKVSKRRFRAFNSGSSFGVIDGVSFRRVAFFNNKETADQICDRWNLQEYEGIDDTEGHL